MKRPVEDLDVLAEYFHKIPKNYIGNVVEKYWERDSLRDLSRDNSYAFCHIVAHGSDYKNPRLDNNSILIGNDNGFSETMT